MVINQPSQHHVLLMQGVRGAAARTRVAEKEEGKNGKELLGWGKEGATSNAQTGKERDRRGRAGPQKRTTAIDQWHPF